ncbi:PREDICTED: T-cell immunoglobulin and mucin domain-containing protein 4-like, partial [Miniopterus natalensis]|uniref:T-cell immunoglobulin and mucin domain-containing protein 4-like n=1 Tax=Miniopterus natalensis TaxID=291302 RepID=UPI0007A7187A
TAMTTTTAALPTTAVTTPDLATRTLQARTTTALATVATTCPLTTPGALPETTTVLPTTEPSTEGSTLTAESETLLLSEVTSGNTTLLTPKGIRNTNIFSPVPFPATEMTDFVDEAEPGQAIRMDSAFLAKIIASSLGFVLCALIVGLFLRGKVMKTNCFQKHTRLHNPGESKNVLDDIQHGREDEEGLFTL